MYRKINLSCLLLRSQLSEDAHWRQSVARSNGLDRVGKVQRVRSSRQNYLCCMDVLCMWAELLTGLHMLGCEMHKMSLASELCLDPLGEL